MKGQARARPQVQLQWKSNQRQARAQDMKGEARAQDMKGHCRSAKSPSQSGA